MKIKLFYCVPNSFRPEGSLLLYPAKTLSSVPHVEHTMCCLGLGCFTSIGLDSHVCCALVWIRDSDDRGHEYKWHRASWGAGAPRGRFPFQGWSCPLGDCNPTEAHTRLKGKLTVIFFFVLREDEHVKGTRDRDQADTPPGAPGNHG